MTRMNGYSPEVAAVARETSYSSEQQKKENSFIHQSVLLMKLKYPTQGMQTQMRKAKRREAGVSERPTLQFPGEEPITVMVPMKVVERKNSPRPVLWLPEEATARYARQVHLKSGNDVARGHIAYYHNGRREKGRMKFYWSLVSDGLEGVEMICRII